MNLVFGVDPGLSGAIFTLADGEPGDVLDMPTVNHFETSFMEHYDEKAQNTNRADGDSLERFGSGVLPDGQTVDTFKHRSPVINYTYARTKPICERLMNTGDVDPSHGARVRYSAGVAASSASRSASIGWRGTNPRKRLTWLRQEWPCAMTRSPASPSVGMRLPQLMSKTPRDSS